MTRLPDWRPRLLAYLQNAAARRFRPGEHDCALFVAGAVMAMTGVDYAAKWRGTYRSLTDGQVALRAAGYADHLVLVAGLFEEVAPSLAQVGDLAALPSDVSDQPGALGVIQGSGVYVLRPAGMAVASRLNIKRAFRI